MYLLFYYLRLEHKTSESDLIFLAISGFLTVFKINSSTMYGLAHLTTFKCIYLLFNLQKGRGSVKGVAHRYIFHLPFNRKKPIRLNIV